jgi:hypothetical protein
MVGTAWRRLALLSVALVVGTQTLSADNWFQTSVASTSLLTRFFSPDAQPLVSYRALRHLAASTRGGRMKASMDAWTQLDPARGFTYQITAEEGSAIIRTKVLLAALQAEQKALAGGDTKTAALTTANYDFLAMSDEDAQHLVKVDVRPRRKHMMLIDGSLFLNGESAELVRVEGELSQRPSFWTRKVHIVREYDTIAGVHVPTAMRSTADVLIVGASTFAMTYRYVEINGRTIDSR